MTLNESQIMLNKLYSRFKWSCIPYDSFWLVVVGGMVQNTPMMTLAKICIDSSEELVKSLGDRMVYALNESSCRI